MAVKESPIINYQLSKTLIFFCLLGILGIAIFFRLWQLDSIPPGLYPDIAINGNDALETLKTGDFKVFYPENNGREGLFMWLIALSFYVFGVSIWSIKIFSAIIGIFTVIGLYLLTQEILKNTKYSILNTKYIALLASFFLATSFWHINFSRMGFRAILLPFVLVFSFYFLFKGFRTKSILNLILAGEIFGLGFYTYISFRLAVLLLAITLFCWLIIYIKEKRVKKFFILASAFLLFTFIVALPIGFYFLQNPQDFIGRATSVSVFKQGSPIQAFGISLISHLGMFNFYGDTNWRHNLPGSPMLPWPIGILFLIGLFYSICSLAKKREIIYYLFLITWFIALLLPGILTYEGIPHALRVIGVIPVVYIFSGIGGWKTYEWVNQRIKQKKLLFIAAFVFLLITAIFQGNKYFVKWGQNPEVKNAFSEDYVKIGNYLNSLPPEIQKYVIVNRPGVPVPWPNGLPMPAQTPMFVESTKYGQPQSVYLLPDNINQIKIEKSTVIVPMGYDQSLFEKLQQLFPQGEILQKNGIWIYKIN